VDMEKEYNTLREEIMHWENRQFTVIGINITLITIILGWIITKPSEWNWDVASTLLLLILTSGSYLLVLFNCFASKIGAYISVYHENGVGWESRVSEFDKKLNFHSVRYALGILYLGLGIMSFSIPYKICSKSLSLVTLFLFFLICVILIITLILMVFTPRKNKYIKLWQELKIKENQTDTVKQQTLI